MRSIRKWGPILVLGIVAIALLASPAGLAWFQLPIWWGVLYLAAYRLFPAEKQPLAGAVSILASQVPFHLKFLAHETTPAAIELTVWGLGALALYLSASRVIAAVLLVLQLAEFGSCVYALYRFPADWDRSAIICLVNLATAAMLTQYLIARRENKPDAAASSPQ